MAPNEPEIIEEEISANELQLQMMNQYKAILRTNEIALKKVFVNRLFTQLNLTKYKVQ